MTEMTTAMPSTVAKPEISISQRILATRRAWAGSSGAASDCEEAMSENGAGDTDVSDTPGRVETVIVADDQTGERLDRVLAMQLAVLSRTRLKALILAGHVAIGGRTIRDPGHRVNAGDAVAVEVPAPEEAAPGGEDIPLAIVDEDDD